MVTQLRLLDPDLPTARDRRATRPPRPAVAPTAARPGAPASRSRRRPAPAAGRTDPAAGSPRPASRYRQLVGAGDDPWLLDEHTRSVGLRGVEAARRALAEAVARTSAA
ncbi:MAG TPA: hypothetical protein VFN60_11760 [Acidimicrobiales bacterium]|nr:hypothetical protein [Acidimicrobiales bacterium]